jgi:hypothetical protein
MHLMGQRPAAGETNEMGTAPRPRITPLAAVAGGFLAGAAGTVAMDTVRYLMSRRPT